MSAQVKDGWHVFYGVDVFVEDGKIKQGVWDDCAVYPYRRNRKYGGWDECSGISVATFRRLINKGDFRWW